MNQLLLQTNLVKRKLIPLNGTAKIAKKDIIVDFVFINYVYIETGGIY